MYTHGVEPRLGSVFNRRQETPGDGTNPQLETLWSHVMWRADTLTHSKFKLKWFDKTPTAQTQFGFLVKRGRWNVNGPVSLRDVSWCWFTVSRRGWWQRHDIMQVVPAGRPPLDDSRRVNFSRVCWSQQGSDWESQERKHQSLVVCEDWLLSGWTSDLFLPLTLWWLLLYKVQKCYERWNILKVPKVKVLIMQIISE